MRFADLVVGPGGTGRNYRPTYHATREQKDAYAALMERERQERRDEHERQRQAVLARLKETR